MPSQRSIETCTLALCLVLAACAGKPKIAPRAVETMSREQPKTTTNAMAQRDYERALTALQRGQTAAAEHVFQRLCEKYPDLAGPCANLALLHFQAGRLDQAEKHFLAAVARNSREPRYYNHLGVVYRNLGRFTDARKAYGQALILDDSYAEAHLNLGILYDLYLGDYSAATRHYQRYAELVPQEAPRVNGWLADLQKRAQGKN